MSKRLNRREFLSVSAMTGYSLFVKVDDPLLGRQNKNIKDFNRLAPKDLSSGSSANEPNMRLVSMDCDVLVAGGGMAGVCAAISAARHGAKVLLVQDRSRLGGNASSEIRMHIVGADSHGSRAGWREGGLIEQLRLEDAARNPHRSWELWDLLLYDKCIQEPNITLLLDSVVYSAEIEGDKIQSVMVRCDKTEHLYRVKAHLYCDCTGDSRLALEAAAEYRQGREGRSEFGESLAVEKTDSRTQGSSILFTSKKYEKPVPFVPPGWARTITKKQLRFRPVGSWEYGYWWIELGGMLDTIRDNEQLRFDLLSVVLGVWDYIKNSGNHPDSANWAMETIGMIPGKRESRRIMGDHVLTQADLEGGWKMFEDGIAIGGWGMDDHPPEGFDAPDKQPFKSIPLPEPYNISFGALYSQNIPNLMMAGRNISCSHVAFSSTRVMATCSVIGQAVGTAAALCVKNRLLPRELRANSHQMKELQQLLLRDDQTIRNVKNEDSKDVAKMAKVTASSYYKEARPGHIINGLTRDNPGEWKNRWAAEMRDTEPWIELHWPDSKKISHIQIIFDSGFQRELTLSANAGVNKRVIRGPQPETVKVYSITARTTGNKVVQLVEVKDNFQRLCRHDFDPIKAYSVRLTIHATHGAKEARLYEIRCYK